MSGPMSTVQRWIGGSPLAVLLKLACLSLAVGVVMAALGLTPLGLFHGLADAARALLDLGFEALNDLGRYLVTGAAIVVPLWLLSRLASARR